MFISKELNKDDRNKILRERYSLLGNQEETDSDGNLLYIPDLEDKMLYYENCKNPELKEVIGNALTEMMGNPNGDDSWIEIC